MISSGTVAGWIAQATFWILIAIGIVFDELAPRWAAFFAVLWVAGSVVLPRLGMLGGLFVTPYVALLDIVLVFIVFKGDVRLR